ncbi:MAG TPA: outer membrane protein OmpK [Thauera sp.]|nr:outer membrane protein OmpK [Thauera sp.]
MTRFDTCLKTVGAACLLAAVPASGQAATWSDTFVGYRYGTEFREPTNTRAVEKHVLQLTHASGYSVGQNFINVDMLQSDKADPASGSTNGATEFYLTYRHQVHLGKLLDKRLAFGPVKEVAITAGFDLNTKNTRFAPRKRLLVVGPTLKFDVPGFLDVSLLYGKEWNHCGLGAPACPRSDISFDPQWIISAAWGIPFSAGSVPLKFQGFINVNSDKGRDYAGVKTRTETLMRAALMVDVGQMAWGTKNTFLMGVGYEYWRNKFGNHAYGNGVEKPGIDTDAPTFQLEWHF